MLLPLIFLLCFCVLKIPVLLLPLTCPSDSGCRSSDQRPAMTLTYGMAVNHSVWQTPDMPAPHSFHCPFHRSSDVMVHRHQMVLLLNVSYLTGASGRSFAMPPISSFLLLIKEKVFRQIQDTLITACVLSSASA